MAEALFIDLEIISIRLYNAAREWRMFSPTFRLFATDELLRNLLVWFDGRTKTLHCICTSTAVSRENHFSTKNNRKHKQHTPVDHVVENEHQFYGSEAAVTAAAAQKKKLTLGWWVRQSCIPRCIYTQGNWCRRCRRRRQRGRCGGRPRGSTSDS